MPAIFTRPYKKYYHAPIFSGATALLLTAAVVLLILPFVLAYLSHCKVIDPLWIKENSYRETPKVTFKKDLVLFMDGISISTSTPFQLMWSTNAYYNDLFPSSIVRNPVVSTTERKDFITNLTTQFDFSIEMPLTNDEAIHHMRAAFIFDYKLSSYISFEMNTLAIVDVASPTASSASSSGIASADIVGDLNLVQRHLLTLDPTAFISLYTMDIFNFTLALQDDPSLLSWSNVMRKYNSRALRTEVNTQPPTILTGRDTSGQPITFTGTIYIPLAQPIAYQPGIAEVLKMSWIQYISLFFLVAVFVVPAYEFMVRMGVVSTWSTTDRIPPDYSSVGGGVGFKPHHY